MPEAARDDISEKTNCRLQKQNLPYHCLTSCENDILYTQYFEMLRIKGWNLFTIILWLLDSGVWVLLETWQARWWFK